MNTSIQFATLSHLECLAKKDHHVNRNMLERKILHKEILVAILDKKIIAWLRYSLFWGMIPFIDMLVVNEENRNKQVGKSLVSFWEKQMKLAHYKMVMTSSQADEKGQHFFRKMEYKDAGSLILPEESLEIFFIKMI